MDRKLVEAVAYLVSNTDDYWFYEYPINEHGRNEYREKARKIVTLVQEWESK